MVKGRKPRWCLLRPSSERERLEQNWIHPAGLESGGTGRALASTTLGPFLRNGLLSRHSMHLSKWAECVLANRIANLILGLYVKEYFEYTELCLGTNDEPVREFVSRHQRTDQHRWQCSRCLFQIYRSRNEADEPSSVSLRNAHSHRPWYSRETALEGKKLLADLQG